MNRLQGHGISNNNGKIYKRKVNLEASIAKEKRELGEFGTKVEVDRQSMWTRDIVLENRGMLVRRIPRAPLKKTSSLFRMSDGEESRA